MAVKAEILALGPIMLVIYAFDLLDYRAYATEYILDFLTFRSWIHSDEEDIPHLDMR
jgi:hypothetical protein